MTGRHVEPLDAMAAAGVISAAQHQAGEDFAAYRFRLFGKGRPRVQQHDGGGRVYPADPSAADAARYDRARRALLACGAAVRRATERAAIDKGAVTGADVPHIRAGLDAIMRGFAG